MAAMDKQPTRVEQPPSQGEHHLTGARAEVESTQKAQLATPKGGETRGLQPGATHLDIPSPYEQPNSQTPASETRRGGKPEAGKPETSKHESPASQSPAVDQQQNNATPSDIRNNYYLRNPVPNSFGAGGTDQMQEKPPASSSGNDSWQSRAQKPASGDAVTKWHSAQKVDDDADHTGIYAKKAWDIPQAR